MEGKSLWWDFVISANRHTYGFGFSFDKTLPGEHIQVELEPVDDFHLLGFNIDLQQRTITYIQPLQPWKIRDATSAGSQRLALSGLQSRPHTIHKYTYPPSSADAAATELVKLYVQKGHDLTACSRFLKGKSADYGDLCVSPPVPKGSTPPFPPPPFHKAGGSRVCSWREPTKLQVQTRISKEDALSTYLPTTVAHAVHSFGLIHGFSCDPSPKQVSHSRLSAAVRRSSAAVASLQMRTNLLLKTPSI